MPTWDEICQVLEQLRTLILEIQSDLADPTTEQDRRPDLQQLLTACFATWGGNNKKVWKQTPPWICE